MPAPTFSSMFPKVRQRSDIGREGAVHHSLPRTIHGCVKPIRCSRCCELEEILGGWDRINPKSRQRASCHSFVVNLDDCPCSSSPPRAAAVARAAIPVPPGFEQTLRLLFHCGSASDRAGIHRAGRGTGSPPWTFPAWLPAKDSRTLFGLNQSGALRTSNACERRCQAPPQSNAQWRVRQACHGQPGLQPFAHNTGALELAESDVALNESPLRDRMARWCVVRGACVALVCCASGGLVRGVERRRQGGGRGDWCGVVVWCDVVVVVVVV